MFYTISDFIYIIFRLCFVVYVLEVINYIHNQALSNYFWFVHFNIISFDGNRFMS